MIEGKIKKQKLKLKKSDKKAFSLLEEMPLNSGVQQNISSMS